MSCCEEIEGTFYSWNVVAAVDQACNRRSTGLIENSLATAGVAGVIAWPTDPTDAVGTPGGLIVAAGALVFAGGVYITGHGELLELPRVIPDIPDLRPDPRLEWKKPKIDRPPPPPENEKKARCGCQYSDANHKGETCYQIEPIQGQQTKPGCRRECLKYYPDNLVKYVWNGVFYDPDFLRRTQCHLLVISY